jgi:hypothetical protein
VSGTGRGELRMERFQGKLMQGGKLMFDNLAGTVTFQTGKDGQQTWSGLFSVPSGVPVRAGGPYRLVLADGRSGDLLITNVSRPSHRPTIVNFQGKGPLQ